MQERVAEHHQVRIEDAGCVVRGPALEAPAHLDQVVLGGENGVIDTGDLRLDLRTVDVAVGVARAAVADDHAVPTATPGAPAIPRNMTSAGRAASLAGGRIEGAQPGSTAGAWLPASPVGAGPEPAREEGSMAAWSSLLPEARRDELADGVHAGLGLLAGRPDLDDGARETRRAEGRP